MHIDTPGFVQAGIAALDALWETHVLGQTEPQYARVSNGGGNEAVTDVFALRAYCWCDGERHPDGCPPNFEHHASGLHIQWYKHVGRGSTMSREVTPGELTEILEGCTRSVKALPPAYRVMVTGSREYGANLFERLRLSDDAMTAPSAQRDVMVNALRAVRKRAGERHIVVVHGAAAGADSLAAALAHRSPNAHAEAWPALWSRAPEGLFPNNVNGTGVGNLPPYYRDEALYMQTRGRGAGFDRRAGFARNEAMLASGIEEVIAFFAEGAGNRGTQGAVNSARRLHIPVTEYRA